jgi:hypothetical protein
MPELTHQHSFEQEKETENDRELDRGVLGADGPKYEFMMSL